MMLRSIALLALAILISCTNSSEVDLESQVEALVSQMTLEEKVTQMAGTTYISGSYGRGSRQF